MAIIQQRYGCLGQTTYDDLEDRAIGAAGNYGFYAKWAHEGRGSRGVEGALCYGLPKHRFGLTRCEAGRSRRSEVSKRLQGGWDEAGELPGVRPRVDGKGKRLREPRTGSPDLRRRFTVVMNTFFSAQSYAATVSDLRAWSEEQLIAAAKTGRRAPFGELCERHVKKVFRVIHRIMRNREDTEDALQDCLLNAFAHVKDFDGRSRFSTWLTRIAINSALAKLRKNHWKREIPMCEPNPACELERPIEIQDDAADPEETYRLRERREILNTAILGLRPRVRRVVELHHLQEHSLRETAQILGISTAAAKGRMFHARVALHRMLLLQSVAKSNRLSAS
jgi:RNA polymerase sigma factor (sigma-70 family)